MSRWVEDVTAFHLACDVPILDTPGWPGADRVELRERLLDEEYIELQSAIAARNLAHTADAIADLIFVAIGAALEFGIPLDPVWDEVQRSNMAKVDRATGKVRRRDDGKILKPEGWKPPEVERIIRAHGSAP